MHLKHQDTRQARLLALALVTLIGVLAVPPAFGFGAVRGFLAFIDPTADLSVDGRRLIITGTGPCAPNVKADVNHHHQNDQGGNRTFNSRLHALAAT